MAHWMEAAVRLYEPELHEFLMSRLWVAFRRLPDSDTRAAAAALVLEFIFCGQRAWGSEELLPEPEA